MDNEPKNLTKPDPPPNYCKAVCPTCKIEACTRPPGHTGDHLSNLRECGHTWKRK